jgi:multimeric flavodoxin WrbA
MKILAVLGSGRKKGNTFLTVQRMEEKLKQLDSAIEFEYLYLSDANIMPCIGCRACFNKGEDHCPRKDDIPEIAQKLLAADGVIFASPTYVCSMSGTMKNFLDRIAYFCHRPAFHGKAAAILTTTAGAGAGIAAHTIRLPAGSMGFSLAGSLGITLHTGDVVPVPAQAAQKLDRLARALYMQITGPRRDAPTVFSLVSFYLNRRHYMKKDTVSYDYHYFREKGWLEPGRAYYTDAKPTVFQKMAAHVIRLFLKAT